MFKVSKILYKQLELLAKDSDCCMPGELPKNSQAMVETSKELLMRSLTLCVLLCFIGYLGKSFAVSIVKFCRR